jgi:hypothetical protein
MPKPASSLFAPVLLISALCGNAQGQGNAVPWTKWIQESDLVFSAQVFLTDTTNPDAAHRGWGHIQLEPGTNYKYAQSLSFEKEERYVHYRVRPGGFKPMKGKRYVFFVKRMQEPGKPDFLCLVEGSAGAVRFTKSVENAVCEVLYPPNKSAGDCKSWNCTIPLQKLNEPSQSEAVLALASGLPDKAWKTLVPAVLCALERDSLRPSAKQALMWLVAERQCQEAIPLLLERIGQEEYEEGQLTLPDHACQPWQALRKIGLPAWEPIEQHLNSCRTYQELKFCIIALNGIKPFLNARRFHDFVEHHYALALADKKPWYRFMMLDMASWEREMLLFQDASQR